MQCNGLPLAPLPDPVELRGQRPGQDGQAQCRGEEPGAEPVGTAVQPVHNAAHPTSEDCLANMSGAASQRDLEEQSFLAPPRPHLGVDGRRPLQREPWPVAAVARLQRGMLSGKLQHKEAARRPGACGSRRSPSPALPWKSETSSRIGLETVYLVTLMHVEAVAGSVVLTNRTVPRAASNCWVGTCRVPPATS
ncbi:uncharacterized protein M6G45_012018 [Spheniscus humboldti]